MEVAVQGAVAGGEAGEVAHQEKAVLVARGLFELELGRQDLFPAVQRLYI